MKGEEINRADLAASFQKSVVDVLVEHTMLAAKDYHMDKIAIAGGVASNGALREAMTKACEKRGYKSIVRHYFLYRQCGDDRRGSLLRIYQRNTPWMGLKCSS